MKVLKFIYSLLVVGTLFSPLTGSERVSAQEGRTEPQQIDGSNGSTFMQEESPAPRRPVSRSAPRVYTGAGNPPRENIQGANGTFMEEVTPDSPQQHKGRVPIDLSNVGVQVDKQGNLVPLRQTGQGPVQQQYNSGIQAYQEIPVPTYNGYGPAGAGTTFIPVAPGTIPGIRSMNLPYGYYPAGQSRLGAPAIGLSPYGMNPYGFNPYGMNPYGIAPYGIPPYGLAPYGYGSYYGNSYYGNSYYGGYRPGLNLVLPPTRQYSSSYSQTSLVGPQSSMIMPLFQNDF
jgi:hypothetical protein